VGSDRAGLARGLAIVAIVGLLILAISSFRRGRAPDEPVSTAKPPVPGSAARVEGSSHRSPAGDRRVSPTLAAEEADPEPPPATAQERLAHARETLDHYRQATRYPPESQRMRDNPDHDQPHWVPQVTYRLARRDRKLTDANVTVRQDRRFLVGDESARLSIRCENTDGPESCRILSASAGKLGSPLFVDLPSGPPLTFTDDHDGWYSATFQPAAQGFAGYHGLIAVGVMVRVGSEEGATGFQLEYTPEPPATFTGAIEESLKDGSIALDVGMNVARAGRYVLSARVDDAQGRTFAFLSFNEELPAGAQRARLLIFGKLVRDERPQQPFRLRDVEGFRLLENASPDRELMAMLPGSAHTTRVYPESAFSDAEWESEERRRHLDELSKDVESARREVDARRGTTRP